VFDGPSELLTNERLREIYKTASEELILPDASEVRDRPRLSPDAEAALA
jgi:phosphonate transport system ATP-binding protein